MGILDSQSVKTASMTKKKGIDANKKVSGRKRFITTDTLGLLIAVVLTSANTGEREGVRLVFKELQGKFPRLAKTLADQGFDGKEFFALVFSSFGWVLEISDTKSVDCRKNLWVVFGY
ncbi:MAG: transposase [Saprospiraceae bacterium]|nr:transposase [Saprospiraceae bacterium]